MGAAGLLSTLHLAARLAMEVLRMCAAIRRGCIRGSLFPVMLLCATITWAAEPRIRSLTNLIDGHAVGGVTADMIGTLYVADFGETVWKVTPEGERTVFASGLYGASGNAIDNDGNLLQSNYYGNSITRIDRRGEAKPFVTHGLRGPVGITINRQTGDIYVANCSGNYLAKVSTDGTATPFAKSDLFRCPNGISIDPQGNLYTVNFRNNQMLKIDPHGAVAPFATLSQKGLGHLCFRDDRFFVTAYASHEIYEVKLDGTARRILGNGEPGIVDGTGSKARLSFPNGIACNPWGKRLYINEFVGNETTSLPRRAIIREITLDADE
jgi:DNA-binding beta-propeller fold protein YncE